MNVKNTSRSKKLVCLYVCVSMQIAGFQTNQQMLFKFGINVYLANISTLLFSLVESLIYLVFAFMKKFNFLKNNFHDFTIDKLFTIYKKYNYNYNDGNTISLHIMVYTTNIYFSYINKYIFGIKVVNFNLKDIFCHSL